MAVSPDETTSDSFTAGPLIVDSCDENTSALGFILGQTPASSLHRPESLIDLQVSAQTCATINHLISTAYNTGLISDSH